jgi:hypothetical protein
VVNTEGEKSSQIRKSLKGFKTKDPFKVQGLGSGGGGSSSDSGSVEVQDAAAAGASGSATGGGGTDSGSGDTSFTPPSSDTSGGDSGSTTPGLKYFQYTVDVRFGKGENLDKKRLEQFRALPSSENPVVVFMGARTDGETAVFLVSSASSTTGEGNCEPDDTCTFLYMKKGDEQRIEAVNENNEVVTYELVLLGIDVERTDGPEKAAGSSSRSKRSKRSVADVKGKTNPFARGFQAIGF